MRKRYGALVAMLLCASVAAADKVDDFRDTVSRRGCDSIRYGRSQPIDVRPWCDGSRAPVTCDSNGTRNMQASISREQRGLDTLAGKAKWTAELEAVDRDIDAA